MMTNDRFSQRSLGHFRPKPPRPRHTWLRTAALCLTAALPLALPPQAGATGGGGGGYTNNCIDLKKEISIDGGRTYYDANTLSNAVKGAPPKNAHYRLTVSNCGTATLDRVKVSDAALGLYGVTIPGSQTGRLAPRQTVVITSSSARFGKLYVPSRCATDGTYANVAAAEGFVVGYGGWLTGTKVRDDDVAYLTCTGKQPALSLEKQVRVPGGAWMDADTAGEAVTQTLTSGVEYRLIVTNVGHTGLMNVRISDEALGIANVQATGWLAVGQTITITAARSGFQNLSQPLRCTTSGELVNTAVVTATPYSARTQRVSAEDPAWVKCEGVPAGNPEITLKKQISLDDSTWSDADTVDNALQGTFPQGAWYRLVITNTGDETLENITVTDSTLGLYSVSAGVATLAPNGGSVTLYSSTSGFEALVQPDRCTAAGQFSNTARVEATSQVDGAPVADEDTAVLVCVGTPAIDLQKQVSVDGGATWLDADTDTDAAAALVGAGARYRLVITNVGTQGIGDLSISDPSLGLSNVPVTGSLANNGDAVTLTASDSGFEALNQPTRCASAGNLTNTATVNGTSVDTDTPVSDTDSAVVRCAEPPTPPAIELKKQVSVDGGSTWLDADTETAAAIAQVGAGVQYRLVISNVGGESVGSLHVTDPRLGIDNVSLDDGSFGGPIVLAAGEYVTISSGFPGFGALNQPNRCASAGAIDNSALVNGTSVDTHTSVQDLDLAWVRCEAPLATATCSQCTNLDCLLNANVTACPTAGQDVCTTTVFDEPSPIGGAPARKISRGCGVRADALAAAAANIADCENVEGGLLDGGPTCVFVCDGVGYTGCNHPRPLIPTEGRLTP